MATSLCATFQSLAVNTWTALGEAWKVKHQLLEETITDLNILTLKVHHPTEVYSQVFTKPREGVEGADWEWWLTDGAKQRWLGLRVQAKIVNLAKRSFPHLHYKKGNAYQTTKLKRASTTYGLVPLYCFYSHGYTPSPEVDICETVGTVPEILGCSLASVEHVEMMRKLNQTAMDYVLKGAVPWHCLVCCSAYSSDTLPERAIALLQHRLRIHLEESANSESPLPGIRLEPPAHVRLLMEGERLEEPPSPGIQGIVILKED